MPARIFKHHTPARQRLACTPTDRGPTGAAAPVMARIKSGSVRRGTWPRTPDLRPATDGANGDSPIAPRTTGSTTASGRTRDRPVREKTILITVAVGIATAEHANNPLPIQPRPVSAPTCGPDLLQANSPPPTNAPVRRGGNRRSPGQGSRSGPHRAALLDGARPTTRLLVTARLPTSVRVVPEGFPSGSAPSRYHHAAGGACRREIPRQRSRECPPDRHRQRRCRDPNQA
jgi:hypothetical protein